MSLFEQKVRKIVNPIYPYTICVGWSCVVEKYVLDQNPVYHPRYRFLPSSISGMEMG